MRIEEDSIAEFCLCLGAAAAEEFGYTIEIDVANILQGHGKGVGGTFDQRRGRGMNDPFAENGALLRFAALEVIVLDRGNQPDIGIIKERLQIGPAMGFPGFAGVRIGCLTDRGEIDRAEIALECVVGHAKPNLGGTPRLIALLGAEHGADGIADGDKGADNPRMFGWNAIRTFALPDLDRLSHSVDDLHQFVFERDVGSLLDRRSLRRGSDLQGRRWIEFGERASVRRGMDAVGQVLERDT